MPPVHSYFYVRISNPITSLCLAAMPQSPAQKYSILPRRSRCSGGRSSFAQTIHMTGVMGQPGIRPWETCPHVASDPEEIHQAGDRGSALFTLEESHFSISVMVQGFLTSTACFKFYFDKGQGLDSRPDLFFFFLFDRTRLLAKLYSFSLFWPWLLARVRNTHLKEKFISPVNFNL